MLERFFANRRNSILDEQIHEIVIKMREVHPGSQEHEVLLSRLERLVRLRNEERPSWRISPDTLVMAGANLLGILIIVGYERGHVATSKGFNYVPFLRTKNQ